MRVIACFLMDAAKANDIAWTIGMRMKILRQGFSPTLFRASRTHPATTKIVAPNTTTPGRSPSHAIATSVEKKGVTVMSGMARPTPI